MVSCLFGVGGSPGGCCWTLSPKAPRPVAGGGAAWCQMLELLSLPRASNSGSFPSLRFRPRVHLLQQPQRVEARVLIGPDRGMSLPLSLGWGDVGSPAGRVADLPRQAGDPQGLRKPLFPLLLCMPPWQQPSQPCRSHPSLRRTVVLTSPHVGKPQL